MQRKDVSYAHRRELLPGYTPQRMASHMDRRVTVENLPETSSQAEMESVELTLSIMRLPKQLQEVTILYYYQDMTIREVAQALNVSPSKVSKRLNHAQAKLHA